MTDSDAATINDPTTDDRQNGTLLHSHSPPAVEEEAPATFNATDYGNAERLIHAHGNDLRFIAEWKRWMVWNGRNWEMDESGELVRRAITTIRNIYHEVAHVYDLEERHKLVKWTLQSESNARITAMISLASSIEGVTVSTTALDLDPWLLNVLNGTIDLRTGEIRPHERADLLTKIAPVTYDKNAECPIFDAFVWEILGGSPELNAFVQRAFGYSITGSVQEQCMFMLYGTGANGKSTLLETIVKILGPYGSQTAPELLLAKSNENHPTEIADLMGRRITISNEANPGKSMAEALVKRLTGETVMKARHMREDFFEFTATHKLWLAVNHKPVVRGTDEGIWRRFHMIPFVVTVPPERRDQRLPDKLMAEASGILNWLIDGCLFWQELGLAAPKEVLEATASYRAEMDILGDFIEQKCVIQSPAQTWAEDLYKAYTTWCEENGEHPLKQRNFALRLKERDARLDNKPSTAGRSRWQGIGLKVDSGQLNSF